MKSPDQHQTNNPGLEQFYKESKARLSKLDKYQLVNKFNRETSHRGWVGVRGSFLQV